MQAQEIKWPADKVERRPVKSLIANARNSRTHSEEQVEQIAQSVKEWGWTVPVLIDEEGTIIAGHGRVLAAGRLKLEEVPVMVAEGWSEAQKRAYLIADNKLTENAGWDYDVLGEEFQTLRELGFDMDLMGFGDDDIRGILGELDEAEPDPPRASLQEAFGVAPFSVLNAREGWWQDRKRSWIKLGIKSEVGRGDNLTGQSLYSLIRHNTNWSYEEARQWIEGHREKGLSDAEIIPLIPYRAGGKKKRKADAVPGGGGKGAYLRGGEPVDPKYAKGKTNGGVLMPSHTSGDPSFYAKKRAKEEELGRKLTTDEFLAKHYVPDDNPIASGTSIFDPVLCELTYRWYSAPGWSILDPFAGGSVRGVVANRLGRSYTGVELRPEQVEENRNQGKLICPDNEPEWIAGDATKLDQAVGDRTFDLVFSCPPYADLEVYSDDPADLSNMPYDKFLEGYALAIKLAVERLKENRFACFVVGEVREKSKAGFYRSFVPDTISCFEQAGARFYNEAILITSAGSLPIRMRRQFDSGRKLGKTHQNVLVFCKGDPSRATAEVGPCEFGDPSQSPFAQEEVEL